ncbi:MAG TPA: zf-HC2 domain-containing protein [Thermoleophilaceae bacterium]|nr:zf-HC2 domain-containing protein [Thermoleophilaceae bacterium]
MRAIFAGPRFRLDHRFTQASASDYLDGELAPRGRRRVERHTSVCPQCRRLIETLRRTLVALGEMRVERRPDVTEGVIDRLRRHT